LTGRYPALFLLLGSAASLHGQALPAASRVADAQVGAAFILAKPDYIQNTIQGFGIYADFDFRPHIGVEAELHDISGDRIGQRTYEIGGRYFRAYGIVVPYIKGMVGVGSFAYPGGLTVNYTAYAGGAGADLKLNEHLHLRGDYEYQKWSSFPNGGLTPQLVTISAAYHFTGKRKE
jgi:hypothetical protein